MWDLLLCMGRWHRPLPSHWGCGHKKRVLQMSVEFYMLDGVTSRMWSTLNSDMHVANRMEIASKWFVFKDSNRIPNQPSNRPRKSRSEPPYCMFLLLITTNSEQAFPKMARPKGAISIFGNLPLDHKVHVTLWFPFLDIWPWKSMKSAPNTVI